MAYDCGVYVITNLVNGHRYVGSACSFKKRFREHVRQLSEGRHHSRYFQRAWDKHGSGAFVFEPVLYCDRSNLLAYEQSAMDSLKPEYNIVPVAGSQLGYRHTDETRQKMSVARRRNPSSPRKGMTHTEEAKRKISENRRGKGGSSGWTQLRRDRISAALKGRVITPEQRQKISEKLQGHKQSAETIAKRSEKLRGRKMPSGFAEATSRRMKGIKLPADHCENIGRSKAKLTDAQVVDIRLRRASGERRDLLASEFEIDPATITNIVRGKTYRWVA